MHIFHFSLIDLDLWNAFCEVSPWGSFLFTLQRQKKVCTPGDEAIMKIHKKLFSCIPFNFTLFVISPKLQRIWSWNFGFAIRKIWAFMWYQNILLPVALGDENVIGIRAFKLYFFLNNRFPGLRYIKYCMSAEHDLQHKCIALGNFTFLMFMSLLTFSGTYFSYCKYFVQLLRNFEMKLLWYFHRILNLCIVVFVVIEYWASLPRQVRWILFHTCQNITLWTVFNS